ncbi:MAG: 1-deoxy-D-xylulose-5-phosphate synthase [Oscillospiraceae bacterium]|jgi:1-deoxy-D-xylulose-5-phosphate synthase|nr:1-deoxy-D-xylulose-5-phosphate synthase [Oscillospiraceae bacterium]
MIESIHSPADVRRLSLPEAEALAAEIRRTLIDGVSQTGGHLASNLGVVELTLAMHRAFDMPKDKIVFDVGHQCYTHKLITGRAAAFHTLRAEGGLSGFPKRSESPYDAFETGHASTAVSAALGFARARDAMGEDFAVTALVGDGALTGGLCYEALNDAGSRPTQLIVLLNDNEMSIAHNVGALSHYLTRLRGSRRWIGAKSVVKRGLNRLPLVGRPLARTMDRIKRTLRLLLVPGEFFETLGFAYLGPIDGHDIGTIERALRDARAMKRPVVVHAVTHKGKGYAMAERRPDAFHGVAPFFVEDGRARAAEAGDRVSAAQAAGDALAALAKDDARITAITAAMPQGTGLSAFAKAYPDRFFDVGIAEEHAITLAAGMAAGGLRPVVGLYASFLQRAVDQLLHDVCLQNLPVVLLVGNAGFVSGDGATHQGVYDLPMLRAMPNLTIFAPADARELAAMLQKALSLGTPCVVRHPKRLPRALGEMGEAFAWRCIKPGQGAALIGHGASVQTALKAAEGTDCAVWSASTLLPLDEKALNEIAESPLVAVIEESARGGLGAAVAAHMAALPKPPRLLLMDTGAGVPDAHSLEGLRKACGQDAEAIARRVREAIHGQ